MTGLMVDNSLKLKMFEIHVQYLDIRIYCTCYQKVQCMNQD